MSDNMQGACDGTAVLTRELHVRVINVSVSGCLVESHQRLDVGAVATLRVVLGGQEYTDDVQILRCQVIRGGSVHHLGAQFLWTTPPHDRSIRHAVTRHVARLARVSGTTRVM